jgi:hypothetical protein
MADSELVAILKSSRFADEFEFQPATKEVCSSSGNVVSYLNLKYMIVKI